MSGSSAQLANHKHSRPSVCLAIDPSTRSVPCLTDLRLLELSFALSPACAPPFESLQRVYYTRQQPRRLAPQDHRAPSPGALSPSPWSIGSRSTQYTTQKSPVVSVKTLRTRVPTQELPTLDSALRDSRLKNQGSRLKAQHSKTGHLQTAPHHPPEPHRRRASAASAVVLLFLLLLLMLLARRCCCCCCPSSPLGLGTQWSPKCSCPSHPMYCQGTGLRGAAQTVQHGYDDPLPHGIRGYLEPLLRYILISRLISKPHCQLITA